MLPLTDILNGGAYSAALKACRDGKNISVFDARFFEKAFFACALAGKALYVCADSVAAREMYDEIKGIREDAVLLSEGGDVLTYKRLSSATGEPERLCALYGMASGASRLVVTSLAALTRLYPERERFVRDAFTLRKNEDHDLAEIKEKLVRLGYRACSAVESAGYFSSRGDILDLWAVGEEAPVRAEFFGDTLDSLRNFDPTTYLSEKERELLCVIPATDIFYTESEGAHASEALAGQAKNERTLSIAADINMKLAAGASDLSLSYIRPLLPHVSLKDFYAPDFVVYDDAKSVYDTAQALYKEFADRLKALLSAGEVLPFHEHALLERESVFDFKSTQVAFHRISSNNRIFHSEGVVTFSGMDIPDYSRDFLTLANDLKGWQGSYKVDIMCGGSEAVKNIGDFLSASGVGFSDGGGEINLYADHLNKGGIFHASKRVVIGTYDISTRRRRAAKRRRGRDVFTVPEIGDYVVHETHGIGYCAGVEKMNLTGAPRDYLIIEYEGGDKLYVPVENMDSLSKYVASGEKPKLSKIGGADFARVKKKVRESVKKLAFDLIGLYAERSVSKGHKYGSDDTLLDEFCADFPFTETEDQLTAVAEGLADLKAGKVMDRLLCGDVGYGKTEVALRLAFKVISEGRQAAFVSPTTILACQHFDTAVKRMERYGVRVERLTRFDPPAKAKETLKRLKSGETDFVIGTHRVLKNDVAFKDLGLLILDEEQRFGVADKEKLKLIKPNVNVLSLSATPIPRTLYMTMVNVRDISVLDTPPADRIPVQTFVAEYSDALVRDALARELARGGQAFIVYNRVMGIDGYAQGLRTLLPEARIAVAHGQMKENLLEKTVADFVGGKYDVLVASTIIENGIDMPNANTLIAVDADRLGLAQMYQLRGRVGRSGRMAYAYFTYASGGIMTESAYKRLEAITRYTDFGSGFRIAMADLEIRGAGNILGKEQHGHMEKVGYDLYCKLLEDAVAELEGKQVAARKEVRLTIDFPAYLPETYVCDGEKRMALYSRIALVSSPADKIAFMSELADVYGKPPEEAENLLDAALIKNLAGEIGAKQVIIRGGRCAICYELAHDIPEEVVKTVSASSEISLYLGDKPSINAGSIPSLVNFLLNCHEKAGLND